MPAQNDSERYTTSRMFVSVFPARMPAMESQFDERDHPGIVEHAADVSAVAIGDLRAGNDPAGSGDERRDRMESRHSRQARATVGMHHPGLPARVT